MIYTYNEIDFTCHITRCILLRSNIVNKLLHVVENEGRTEHISSYPML